jgi:imidazoleglycerol-phosphate dehydratase/histidinol-phosphatase
MIKRVLFIDRDGTLIREAPPTYQLDAFNKLEFYPHMFEYLTKIVKEMDFERKLFRKILSGQFNILF